MSSNEKVELAKELTKHVLPALECILKHGTGAEENLIETIEKLERAGKNTEPFLKTLRKLHSFEIETFRNLLPEELRDKLSLIENYWRTMRHLLCQEEHCIELASEAKDDEMRSSLRKLGDRIRGIRQELLFNLIFLNKEVRADVEKG